MYAIRTLPSPCASAMPMAAPLSASSRLSASNCRISRRREAPSVSRKAISRCRAPALASIRLARFAHAINKTSPEMESSTHSGSAYCFRSGEAPVAAGSACKENRR